MAQTVPASDLIWYGDVWKAVVELRQRDDLRTFVIDTDCGLGVVRRASNPAPLSRIDPLALTWTDFDRHRREWLGLISVEEFTRSTA